MVSNLCLRLSPLWSRIMPKLQQLKAGKKNQVRTRSCFFLSKPDRAWYFTVHFCYVPRRICEACDVDRCATFLSHADAFALAVGMLFCHCARSFHRRGHHISSAARLLFLATMAHQRSLRPSPPPHDNADDHTRFRPSFLFRGRHTALHCISAHSFDVAPNRDGTLALLL